MTTSAEIRWFWRPAAPPGFADWFRKGGAGDFPAGGGGSALREDQYLFERGQVELGAKHRNGGLELELKGLVAYLPGELEAGVFRGRIELWNRWSSSALALDSDASLLVSKRRWIRKFDCAPASPEELPLDEAEQPRDGRPKPESGCNAELTQVLLDGGEEWWTFNFEAFGEPGTVEGNLRRVAALLAGRRPPALADGLIASYPAWLAVGSPSRLSSGRPAGGRGR